eukprot:525054_1
MGNRNSSSKSERTKKKTKRRIIVNKVRNKLVISTFGDIPEVLLLKILELLDYQSWNILKQMNGHFYYLMDATTVNMHKLWENKVRTAFPLTPKRLKCKRWDLYFTYKMNKQLEAHGNTDMSWMAESQKPEFMVIEGCDFDINRINKRYKTNTYQETELYKGKINKKGIPEGFDKLKLYCPVIAYENFKYLDYVNNKQYTCIVCKNTVHSVRTLDEAKAKLNEKKCIRVVWTNGRSVFHMGGDYYISPQNRSKMARVNLKYEWDNNDH